MGKGKFTLIIVRNPVGKSINHREIGTFGSLILRHSLLMKLKYAFYLCLSLIATTACAQKRKNAPQTGFGLGLVYNFPVKSIAGELRAKIPVWNRFYAVPEISYFVPFSPIHEVYAGAALHYESPYTLGRFTPYLAAGAYYNNWINIAEYRSNMKDQNNLVPEAGLGIILSHGCIRPYLEGRYDARWKEGTVRFGVLFYPGDCRLRTKKVKCPAYG
jgi:hypothetical protein